MEKSTYFNLLKPTHPPKTLWDKIYDWILGKARVVILITELFIAFSFVAKVVVDTQAKNKTKTIDRLNSQIGFYQNTKEVEFRKIQRKADDYTKLVNGSSGYADVVNEIFSYIPNPGDQITITIDEGEVSIYGYDDLDKLSNFVSSMKASDTFIKDSVRVRDLSLERQEIINETGQYVLKATISQSSRAGI